MLYGPRGYCVHTNHALTPTPRRASEGRSANSQGPPEKCLCWQLVRDSNRCPLVFFRGSVNSSGMLAVKRRWILGNDCMASKRLQSNGITAVAVVGTVASTTSTINHNNNNNNNNHCCLCGHEVGLASHLTQETQVKYFAFQIK